MRYEKKSFMHRPNDNNNNDYLAISRLPTWKIFFRRYCGFWNFCGSSSGRVIRSVYIVGSPVESALRRGKTFALTATNREKKKTNKKYQLIKRFAWVIFQTHETSTVYGHLYLIFIDFDANKSSEKRKCRNRCRSPVIII